jgi:hypothetical protein
MTGHEDLGMRVALLLVAVALSACGEAADTASRPADAVTGDRPATVLMVEQTSGGQTSTWTLRCDPPGGDHPAPDAACADLDALAKAGDPFAPLPEDRICTSSTAATRRARLDRQLPRSGPSRQSCPASTAAASPSGTASAPCCPGRSGSTSLG